MTFFSEKISIFTAKISDDLLLSHRPGFSDFPLLLFPDFPYLYCVKCLVYDPFFKRKTTISEKIPLRHHFLLCSYFRAHPTTLLLKILGGLMHGPSPHLKFFGGTVHPVPLGLRPCKGWLRIDTRILNTIFFK